MSDFAYDSTDRLREICTGRGGGVKIPTDMGMNFMEALSALVSISRFPEGREVGSKSYFKVNQTRGRKASGHSAGPGARNGSAVS